MKKKENTESNLNIKIGETFNLQFISIRACI